MPWQTRYCLCASLIFFSVSFLEERETFFGSTRVTVVCKWRSAAGSDPTCPHPAEALLVPSMGSCFSAKHPRACPGAELACALACTGRAALWGVATGHTRSRPTPWKPKHANYGSFPAEFLALLRVKFEQISLFLRSQTVLRSFMWGNEQHRG